MVENPQNQVLNCGVRLVDGNSEEIEYKPSKNIYNSGFLYSKQPIGKISYYTYPYLLKHNISPRLYHGNYAEASIGVLGYI